MPQDSDVEFLKLYCVELQKDYQVNLPNADLEPIEDYETTEKERRCARLADQYGLKGDAFIDPLPLDANCAIVKLLMSRRLISQIRTINRTIAAIESSSGPQPPQPTVETGGKPKQTEGNDRKRKKPKPRKKRSDTKADKEISDAWKTGQYCTFAALGREKNISEREVRYAVDRHRHRQRAKDGSTSKPRQ